MKSEELPKALAFQFKAGAGLDVAGGWFAGSLSALGIAEVFGHVLSVVRSGQLIVVSGEVRKTLSFRDGQVIFASSTEPGQRLGALLSRMKLATSAQLKDALATLRPGVKLGQALTQAKVLTPAQLFSAMAALVREIAVSVAAHEEGEFLFIEGAPPPEDAIKLPERTRDLLLRGLKLAQETKHPKPPAPPSGAAAAVSPVHERYAALVKVICDALSRAGKDLKDLRSFFEDPLPGMEQAFAGVNLSDAGHLDVARVMKNTSAANEPMGRARAYEALEAFVSYALFSAKNVLPAELAATLARDLKRLQEGA